MSTSFTLDSGRDVSIRTISIRSTYEGWFLGHPQRIAAEISRRTPVELRQEFGEGVTILATKLAFYRFVVVLQSSPLPAAVSHDYSCATICWFQDDLNGNLVEMVRQAVSGLEWEKHARNYSE